MNIELSTWRESIIDCLEISDIITEENTYILLKKVDNVDVLRSLFKEIGSYLFNEKEQAKAENIKRMILEACEVCEKL